MKKINEDVMIEVFERICDRLSDLHANLFLGAGINAGIMSSNGDTFPLGNELSQLICNDLLGDSHLSLTLDEASEYARYKLGEVELNRYLYELFQLFHPGRSHNLISNLPWDTIYTTNYDQLLEFAYEKNQKNIEVVTSIETDLSGFSEQDILYYKLHGTIDQANTPSGRLILTKEDYRTYERLRLPLFKRLQNDLQSRVFVFVGYSLNDPNFREILDNCRKTMDIESLPLSYAVRPNHRPSEADYWKDKYNIQLLDCTAEEFLHQLNETWNASTRTITPIEERRKRNSYIIDDLTSFPTYFDSYYRVLPSHCSGISNPSLFFKGAEASWADIRDEVPPPRDAMWDLMEVLFEEFNDITNPTSIYLISGHAGTGKTTLIRTLSYTVTDDFDIPVVIHIPGTPLHIKHLQQLIEMHPDKRIVIIFFSAALIVDQIALLYEDTKRKKLPITFLLEERTNQWNSAINNSMNKFSPNIFELGPLSSEEIERILDSLKEHQCLGVIQNMDRATQLNHFTALAHKELLVALRELTTGTRFDDIVADEYISIPSALGKEAYKYVAAVGQIDLYIRYNTLTRLLKCDYDELGNAVFKQTEGILVSSEHTGRSRHTLGFKFRVRHPVIASIVFSVAAPTDKDKFDVLNSIIMQLDPGYQEDRSLLQGIIKHRELIRTFENEEFQRAIYDRLAETLPSNQYVYQHRSILERELHNPSSAIKYARIAVQIDPKSMVQRNTLGLALEFAARTEKNERKRETLLREATRIFEEGIQTGNKDQFAYLGLAYVKRQVLERERNDVKRRALLLEAISLLEQGKELHEDSSVLEREYAKLKDELGEKKEAVKSLEEALKDNPGNSRVRDLYITFLVELDRIDEALSAARKGVKYSPTEWRLHRHIARLLIRKEAPESSVIEQYKSAIRTNRHDIGLLVELGGYLFTIRKEEQAIEYFQKSFSIAQNAHEKQKIRCWWTDLDGNRKEFVGRVSQIKGGGAFVQAIPENFEAFYWRQYGVNADLVKGDRIRFMVGFNTYGSRGRILGKHKE